MDAYSTATAEVAHDGRTVVITGSRPLRDALDRVIGREYDEIRLTDPAEVLKLGQQLIAVAALLSADAEESER